MQQDIIAISTDENSPLMDLLERLSANVKLRRTTEGVRKLLKHRTAAAVIVDSDLSCDLLELLLTIRDICPDTPVHIRESAESNRIQHSLEMLKNISVFRDPRDLLPHLDQNASLRDQ